MTNIEKAQDEIDDAISNEDHVQHEGDLKPDSTVTTENGDSDSTSTKGEESESKEETTENEESESKEETTENDESESTEDEDTD